MNKIEREMGEREREREEREGSCKIPMLTERVRMGEREGERVIS